MKQSLLGEIRVRRGSAAGSVVLPMLILLVFNTTRVAAQIPPQDDTSTLRRIGDVIHIALPALAGGSAAAKRDWDGLLQFGTSFGATVGTFAGIKAMVAKDRPDVADRRSFPSGHMALSFSGASFITKRYGLKYGIPALVAAGFVGYTRIEGQKHFADDVVAGAGIALIYNWMFVRPEGENVWIKPTSFRGGYGLTMGFDPGQPGTNSQSTAPPADPVDLKYRFAFEFGALDVRNLDAQAPPGVGTAMSLEEQEKNVTATSRFQFGWMFAKPHEFNFIFAPFEGRDFEGLPTEDILFNGVRFPADETTATRFAFNEVGFRYRYGLVDNRWVSLRLGATLSVQKARATVVQESKDLYSEVVEYSAMPLLHGGFTLHFTPKFHAFAEGDWMRYSGDKSYAGGIVGIRWKPRPKWDVDFGYRRLWRKNRTDPLFSRFAADYYTLGIGYTL